MNVRELLAKLEADDVRLTIKGDRLVLNAPRGVLSAARIEEIRPYKPELLAIVAERQVERVASEPTRDSFDDIVKDARRFQGVGKPGPWGAFTMSDPEVRGVVDALPSTLRDAFDLQMSIYRRDGLPTDRGCRIALFLLASEHNLPLDKT